MKFIEIAFLGLTGRGGNMHEGRAHFRARGSHNYTQIVGWHWVGERWVDCLSFPSDVVCHQPIILFLFPFDGGTEDNVVVDAGSPNRFNNSMFGWMKISALLLVSFGWMSLVSGATGENLHGYSVQPLMET